MELAVHLPKQSSPCLASCMKLFIHRNVEASNYRANHPLTRQSSHPIAKSSDPSAFQTTKSSNAKCPAVKPSIRPTDCPLNPRTFKALLKHRTISQFNCRARSTVPLTASHHLIVSWFIALPLCLTCLSCKQQSPRNLLINRVRHGFEMWV